jgi:hypothetical protein
MAGPRRRRVPLRAGRPRAQRPRHRRRRRQGQGRGVAARRPPATADLTLAIGPGAFLPQGRVGLGQDRRRARRSPGDPRPDRRGHRQRGLEGPHGAHQGRRSAGRLPLSLDARGEAPGGRWRVNGSGAWPRPPRLPGLTLDAAGRMGRTEIKTRETARSASAAPTTARLRLSVGDGAGRSRRRRGRRDGQPEGASWPGSA